MPVLNSSGYKAPLLLKNRHLLTIYPTLFRKIRPVNYKRIRIETADHDFVDLDFSEICSEKIVVLLHGLEGSSNSKYVLGMVNIFNQGGYDTVSVNFRSCSGEPNKTARYYHSGETDDLETVIQYLTELKKYKAIHLIGFSMGGNILLKYTGEKGEAINSLIKSGVAFSVPCDLKDGATEMGKKHNAMYMKRFMRELEQKLKLKSEDHAGEIDMLDFNQIKTFKQFDDRYTAPLHGFKNAEDYWEKSSSKPYLLNIRIPVLLINALDDPFLGKKCFPYEEADKNSYFYLETPRSGGHVGFVGFNRKVYWSEKRAFEFIHYGATIHHGKHLSHHP